MGIHGLNSWLPEKASDFVGHPWLFDFFRYCARLETRFFKAIESGDAGVVQYMLDAGMCPHMISMGRWRPMGAACNLNQLAVAKLLRSYGAELVAFYEKEPAAGEPGAGEPSEDLLHYTEPTGELLAWLQSHPPRGDRKPLPARSEAPMGLAWPPLGLPEQSLELVPEVEALRDARRAYRLEETLERWAKVRAHVATRAVAVYWQGRTQARLCAPGGAGRAADRAAFEKDA